MSEQNSAAESAAELASILSRKLQKPKFPSPRNNTLRERLDSSSFPQTPSNPQDALSFFRVLFCKVSYVEESFRGEPQQISYQNIFIGLDNSDRIGFFRVFLHETCNEYFHFDALYRVLMEQMGSFQGNIWKYFIINAMMSVRLCQRKLFPPKPDEKVIIVCPALLQEILELMVKKAGGEEQKRLKEANFNYSLKRMNKSPNESHTKAIKKLLESDPNFFQKWLKSLSNYFHGSYEYQRSSFKRGRISTTHHEVADMHSPKGEKKWISLMRNGCPEFLKEMHKFGISDETIRWIFFYFIQQNEYLEYDTFNDLMTYLASKHPMPFPFEVPPQIYLTNHGGRKLGESSKAWGRITVDDLREICIWYDFHEKFQSKTPGSILSAAILRRLTPQISRILDIPKRIESAIFIQRRIHPRFCLILEKRHAEFLILSVIKRKNYIQNLQKMRSLSLIYSMICRKKSMELFQRRLAAFSILSAFRRKKSIGLFQRRLAAFSILSAFRRKKSMEHFQRSIVASVFSRMFLQKIAAKIGKRLIEFDHELSVKNSNDCDICAEPFRNSKILPCGHVLCGSCFWEIDSPYPCPYCRVVFQYANCKEADAVVSRLAGPPPSNRVFFS